MGKKKSAAETRNINMRVSLATYRKVEELFGQGQAGVDSLSGMASFLIEEALRRREQPDEVAWERMLTHFEERITERIRALNWNLRAATGMLLVPKPRPKVRPPAELVIESEEDVRSWLDQRFTEIPD